MNANVERQSAQIIPFPIGGRAAVRNGTPKAVPPLVVEVGSGSWYHEEAIREAERSRRN